jgi:hypothetical protein
MGHDTDAGSWLFVCIEYLCLWAYDQSASTLADESRRRKLGLGKFESTSKVP